MRILLLDSRPEADGLMKTLITHMHHQVTLARSIEQTLAFLAMQTFDCIICDLPMAEEEGCGFVKKVATAYDIPCIAHTTPVTELDRQTALEAGYFDFLPKPVDYLQLKETLDRISEITNNA